MTFNFMKYSPRISHSQTTRQWMVNTHNESQVFKCYLTFNSRTAQCGLFHAQIHLSVCLSVCLSVSLSFFQCFCLPFNSQRFFFLCLSLHFPPNAPQTPSVDIVSFLTWSLLMKEILFKNSVLKFMAQLGFRHAVMIASLIHDISNEQTWLESYILTIFSFFL